MSFDFEAFITGLTVDLPREQVPLYTIINQARIDELNEQIEAERDPERPESGVDRESSSGVTALVRERDALVKEQDESAKWITLRCLSMQEFADTVQADDKDLLDQIAAQTGGTENEMTRDDVARLREALQPAAWGLLTHHANRIVEQRMVMPDFSPTTSASPSTPTS